MRAGARAPAVGGGRLAVDVVGGTACCLFALMIFHQIGRAAALLPPVGAAGLLGVLAAGVAAVGVAFMVAHRRPLAACPAVRQFLRFGCTGILNAAIDFGVLNLLVLGTGVYAGFGVVPLNLIAFTVASVNSFTWNKLWTFGQSGRDNLLAQFSAFYAVALGGALLGSGILWALTTLVPRPGGIGPILWINAAKLAAAAAAAVWDFLWYRGWVFRHRPRAHGGAGGAGILRGAGGPSHDG